jgi:hypothetical protein
MPIINNLKFTLIINNIINMGIYDNGSIFGIRIYNFNDDDFANILFEEKYDEIMSYGQMREAYLFYSEFNNNKNELCFQYYTECSSTYCEGIYLSWYPMSLNLFLEKFGI